MNEKEKDEIEELALILINSVDQALKNGVKHYRVSDNKLLITVKEIIETLNDEGQIILEE